jgi:hypothetical protein
MLVDRCSCGNGLSWADGSVVKCRDCTDGDVRRLTAQPADSRTTAPDRWVIDRFVGTNQVSAALLDDVPLGYAVELLRRVGTLDLHGYRTKWPRLSGSEDNRNARIRGFELIASDTVEIALERAYEGRVDASGETEPPLSRMYGWFYPWFLTNGGARLYPVFGQRLFEHAGTKIQVTRRAFQRLSRDGAGSLRTVTLSEAASNAKVTNGTMRKLLQAENLIRTEKRKGVPISVDRSVAERIARDVATGFNLNNLQAYLGIRRNTLDTLVRSKTVPMWIKGGKGGNRGRHSYLFREADIANWLKALLEGAPAIRNIPPDTVSLADAPWKHRISTAAFFDAVMRRIIPIRCVIGEGHNLANAYVDIADVLKGRARPRSP